MAITNEQIEFALHLLGRLVEAHEKIAKETERAADAADESNYNLKYGSTGP